MVILDYEIVSTDRFDQLTISTAKHRRVNNFVDILWSIFYI